MKNNLIYFFITIPTKTIAENATVGTNDLDSPTIKKEYMLTTINNPAHINTRLIKNFSYLSGFIVLGLLVNISNPTKIQTWNLFLRRKLLFQLSYGTVYPYYLILSYYIKLPIVGLYVLVRNTILNIVT